MYKKLKSSIERHFQRKLGKAWGVNIARGLIKTWELGCFILFFAAMSYFLSGSNTIDIASLCGHGDKYEYSLKGCNALGFIMIGRILMYPSLFIVISGVISFLFIYKKSKSKNN